MKATLFFGFSLLTLALNAPQAFAGAEPEPNRHIINGDLVYSAQASASAESEAVGQAEGRAAHYLSVECSVPPKESRIYRQLTTRTDGRFEASVDVGVSLEDCDKARAATSDLKAALTNQALAEMEKRYVRPEAAPAPRMAIAAAPVNFQFSRDQLLSHERSLDRRVAERERERQRLKPASID